MLNLNRFAGIISIIIFVIYYTKVPVAEKSKMKYILQWSHPKSEPFNFMGEEQERFLGRGCLINNCFITPNMSMLTSLTDFDAILFNAPEFCQKNVEFPPERSPHQKYVFVSRESPAYYPLKLRSYDGIFNWTYTYKLNSDIYFGFIIIKNKQGEIIGPKKDMQWLEVTDMKTVDNDIRNKLRTKRIAAAWFVSNCKTWSLREKVALRLRNEMAKYLMVLDIYSDSCPWKNTKSCPKEPGSYVAGPECLQKLEKDYYFYLSFENSRSEDYVTEKLLNAVQHHTVPIVYGGANYTRFLPDGSYLNVRTLGLRKIVATMVKAITNKTKYYEFFKWTNHYSYHRLEETPETDYMCALCRAINDDDLVKQISEYKDMKSWWKS